jgi:hypothetical protein
MTSAERLHRRRCIGLRIAVLFAVFLAVSSRHDWAIIGVAAAGALLAIGAYWRDCRRPGPKSSQSDTHTRDSER